MKNRTVFTITLLFFTGIVTLFIMNLSTIFKSHKINEKYLKYNHVRGMAVEYNNLLYTLNFNQQNDIVEMLNHSVRVVGVKPDKRKKPEISKIIIYQFEDKPDIIITPIAYINENLVYSAPDWNEDNYLMEINQGRLQKLLAQTYDP